MSTAHLPLSAKSSGRPINALRRGADRAPARRGSRARAVSVLAHKVEITFEGTTHVLEVGEDESILFKALDAGIDLPHDCDMGVCMTCPAKLAAGKIDQGAGMLSEDTVDKGYMLLCVATPQSDVKIDCIPEDEVLAVQMGEI
mmetsp:Transcript_23174/g.64354  ORF Transcript_23174/g.64354 Transcript_23174/m.64354 type:complete len:143 (+) Transcript_23174:158-586(+)|eukprot:CAMPEP_0117654932 /NCGR_PEP_ID=MMETSP0804-20121206/4012_1 /TAXON_ID=1074897 /ORGANISM="Tetraselmis astigmatica, Strain CCMP880" /LENGTH=142 /DNA_ID=CAMNT_0005461255 /DNA_START=101 /DNA_END=529 /DNA_ORIENTATION=-